MNNLTLALEGAWRVLVASLLLGAGLPALFGLGVRFLAIGTGGDAEVSAEPPRPVGKLLAGICFAIVVAAALLGIVFIVASGFGRTVSFEHIYPTIVEKS